jgi:hypothetical protein
MQLSWGELLARQRITDDAAGYRLLLELLAGHGDTPPDPIPVAIETSHGLDVATLHTGSRAVYAVNPLSAARYRDRHAVSRKSPTLAMPWCWRTSCAPRWPPTGPCPRTLAC